MTNSTYMNARKQYARPQAILFSEDSGELSGGSYVPSGYEIGNSLNNTGSFIILSDHGRGPLDFGVQRIENRQRMVNGRMRSYWIADKRTLSVSWDMLPSRSFSADPNIDTETGLPTSVVSEYTVDGGAGKDTINLSNATFSTGNYNALKALANFEVLGLTAAAGVVIDAAKASQISEFTFKQAADADAARNMDLEPP
jgi:hypothetical protein